MGDDGGILSSGQVSMKGDADAGQACQKVLRQLDIDMEELLSVYIGDIPARQTGVMSNFDSSVKKSDRFSWDRSTVSATQAAAFFAALPVCLAGMSLI